ncbi:MAG: flavin monoamine oxidase family protein [Byssovorax sp.]
MLDSKSVLGYLLEQVRAARATEAGVALVGAALSEECRWHWSLAAELRASRTNNAGKRGLVEICGGFEKLPEAMSQALTRMGARVNFTFEREVTAIHLVNGKARVEVRHAGTKQRLPHLTGYDRVLCTLPFPVMRRIELTGVSPAKLRAIRNMEYASSTKVLLHCSDRFWEKGERPILGGSSISDRLTRQTYYPSDSVPVTGDQVLLGAAAPEPEGFWSTQTQFDELPEAPAPARADANGAPRPGVLLGSYSWCDNARQLGKLTHHHEGAVTFDASSGGEFRALVNHVLGDIKHIHPEVTDHFVNGAAIFWDEYRWSKGAFAITPPGDLSHYYQDGQRREGNLSFAGEHLSIAPGWIQGALESGLRAVLEMLSPSRGDD